MSLTRRRSLWLAAIAFVVLFAPTAGAQQFPGACAATTPAGVVVTLADGSTIRGTLLCLTGEELVLAQDGRSTTTSLRDVRRVTTRADPVWDGAVKGAILPVVMWAVFCHECDAGPMLRAAAGYGLIGLAWDSLQRNTRTIYAAGPSVRWHVRF